MFKVAIIDYGSGNIKSAFKAFQRAGMDISKQTKIIVSNNPNELSNVSSIVLPGVGAFSDCLDGLAIIPGMLEVLQTHVLDNGRPFLGICVGMQLLADFGLENGHTEGLGWVSGKVVPLAPEDKRLKIPHMGWNNLQFFSKHHPVLDGLDNGGHAYFVHSYHFKCSNPDEIYATVDHGEEISAIVGKDNIVGTQFHPEKSQLFGLRLIQNFLNWKP